MCTVNVHWHIGAEHRSEGEYDETAAFDHPNKDTYTGSHRRLASADGGMRIGHMCNVGKQLWDEADPSVRNTDGSVNEYDWKYCKDMHVGLTYEFLAPLVARRLPDAVAVPVPLPRRRPLRRDTER